MFKWVVYGYVEQSELTGQVILLYYIQFYLHSFSWNKNAVGKRLESKGSKLSQ